MHLNFIEAQMPLFSSDNSAGSSVYGPEAKRRKTESERQAEQEKRKEREALSAATDRTAEWAIGVRQPWADKTVAPAKPTEEQLAWLKEEGFIKEEDEEEAAKVRNFKGTLESSHCLESSANFAVTSRLGS